MRLWVVYPGVRTVLMQSILCITDGVSSVTIPEKILLVEGFQDSSSWTPSGIS